tara:strand:+ start:312 stop:539 length:228 start_codon:yes stop_codon:yes gene_type:complete
MSQTTAQIESYITAVIEMIQSGDLVVEAWYDHSIDIFDNGDEKGWTRAECIKAVNLMERQCKDLGIYLPFSNLED